MSAIRSTLCSAALVASLLVACSAKTDNPPTATQGGLAPGGAGGGSGGTAGGDDAGSGSGGEAGTSVPDGGICNSTTCSGGCCSTSGCQAGNLPAACGIGGVPCTICNASLSQSCVGGTCY